MAISKHLDAVQVGEQLQLHRPVRLRTLREVDGAIHQRDLQIRRDQEVVEGGRAGGLGARTQPTARMCNHKADPREESGALQDLRVSIEVAAHDARGRHDGGVLDLAAQFALGQGPGELCFFMSFEIRRLNFL